jgi:hypothetical protein
MSDMRDDIENLKNSLCENNEKLNQSFGRMIDMEFKL